MKMPEKGPPLKPTRVLLLGMPTMLRQILLRIAADTPELDVVAELPDADLDSPDVLTSEADVVIAGADRASEDAVTSLLRHRHSVRILGISDDGRHGTLYEMRPHRVLLGELAPATLVAVIRGDQTGE